MTRLVRESAMIGEPERSWIASTGQRWRLAVFATLILAAFAVLIGMVECDKLFVTCSGRRVLFLLTLLAGLTAAAFGWFVASLRCPHCGHSVGTWILRNASFSRVVSVL